MQAGLLRRRVVIKQRSNSQDTFGQPVLTWTIFATVWADIQPLSGRELEVAQAINSEVRHQVVMRYMAGITAAMRAEYQGRIFNIESVIDVETRHRTLQLLCSEGLNDG